MPVRLSNMAANEASVTITGEAVGDGSVTVVYYPNKINDSTIQGLYGGLDGLNETLATVIKSWDLLADDDSMIPFDIDTLATISFPFKVQVGYAIAKDMRPN